MLTRGSNYFGLSLAAAFASAGIGLNAILAAVRFGGDFALIPRMAQRSSGLGDSVAALGAHAAHQALGFASGLLALSIFSASMITSDGRSSLIVRQTGDRKRDQQSRDHEYAKKFLHVRCSSQYILLVHIAIAADCYRNTLPISEGQIRQIAHYDLPKSRGLHPSTALPSCAYFWGAKTLFKQRL